METLANIAIANSAILGLRVVLLAVLVMTIISFAGIVIKRVRYELDKLDHEEPPVLPPEKVVWPLSIRIGIISAIVGVMVWSFQTSPYIPKSRVVDETSTVAAKAEAERTQEKLSEGVKESTADAKVKERKSDINIREKFETLPDK